MKKVVRLTESDLARIVKRVLREQMEGGPDYGDPKTHFDTVEKALIPKGFKKTVWTPKTYGVIDLTKSPGGHKGIIVRYINPAGNYFKEVGYVIQILKDNVYVKQWKPEDRFNMYDVIKFVEGISSDPVKQEGGSDPVKNEDPGPDRNWWALDLEPKLKAAGFKTVTDPSTNTDKYTNKCYYKCCTYMYKGSREKGTVVFLDCGKRHPENYWQIFVYNNGGQNVKKFEANEIGAPQAVKYALSLK
jgi:hypothetical protein